MNKDRKEAFLFLLFVWYLLMLEHAVLDYMVEVRDGRIWTTNAPSKPVAHVNTRQIEIEVPSSLGEIKVVGATAEPTGDYKKSAASLGRTPQTVWADLPADGGIVDVDADGQYYLNVWVQVSSPESPEEQTSFTILHNSAITMYGENIEITVKRT